MKPTAAVSAALSLTCLGFTASAATPLTLPAAQPIDPAYLANFASCDTTDRFGGVQFPIKSPTGKTLWYGCKTDPGRFRRFDRSAASGNQPEAIIIVSKLGHDEDGSAAACHHAGGPTDQCATSLMLKATAHHPCQIRTPSALCVPVNPDETPYVVIPTSAPRTKPPIEAGAFRRLSGVSIGDYGVVIVGDKIVPVIIADGGPAYKIGEGSTALLKALSTDGQPHTISSGVTFVLFPRTRLPAADLNADTLPGDLKGRALDCFAALTGAAASIASCHQPAASP